MNSFEKKVKGVMPHAENIYAEAPDYYREHNLSVRDIAVMIVSFLEYFQEVRRLRK